MKTFPLFFLFFIHFSPGFTQPQLFLHQRTSIRLLNDSELVTLSDVSKEFITCKGTQNVEWFYEGHGEPSKLQESSSIRINKAESESIEYYMTSRISIYPKQSDTDLARHTGKYVCQEVGKSSAAVSVYLFVGRRNAPAFLHSRKTISLVLSEENITDSSFLVPCATSTPMVNSSLWWRPSGALNTEFKLVPLNSEGNNTKHASFDARYGFKVNFLPQQNLSLFHGDYKCLAKILPSASGHRSNENVEDFVIYSFIEAPSFRAFPSENTVFTSTILNLTCESTEEPVILKEVKVRPISTQDNYAYDMEEEEVEDVASNSVEDIEETIEKNENKLHVANYLELNPVPGSYGEFQCLAEKDRRVLHSWQYRILGKKEEKLSGIKFNKREGSFSCRSKSGIPGKVSFVSCRTPSECRINSICLQKSENCRGYSNATKALCHRGNQFCGKIFYKGGSGLIRCVGDGIDQIRGFTDESNDQRLRMGFHKLKPSETAFLSLNVKEEDEATGLKEGDEVEVTLKLGFYYFLYPVQWAILFRNGSSLHLTPTSEDFHKSKLHRSIQARLRLPLISGNKSGVRTDSSTGLSPIVGINALIPLRSSDLPSWKTITLPITVHSENRVEGPLQLESRDDLEEEGSGNGRSDLELGDETTQNSLSPHFDENPIMDQSSKILLTEEEEVVTVISSLGGGSIVEDESEQDFTTIKTFIL